MRRLYRLLMFAVVVALVLVLLPSVALATKTLAPNQVGAKAYSYVQALIDAPRVAGTPGEVAAALKVGDWFTRAGYSPTMQPFTYDGEEGNLSSQNVIAFRAATKRPKSNGSGSVDGGGSPRWASPRCWRPEARTQVSRSTSTPTCSGTRTRTGTSPRVERKATSCVCSDGPTARCSIGTQRRPPPRSAHSTLRSGCDWTISYDTAAHTRLRDS